MADRITRGAKRAAAVVGHELASPLSALYTFAKLAAKGDAKALARLVECADRIKTITDTTRELAHAGGEPVAIDLAELIERRARELAIEIVVERDGAVVAAVAPALATFVVTTALRSVEGKPRVRIGDRDGRIDVAIAGGESESWRVVDPWATTGVSLGVWSIAVALVELGGAVRVSGADTIAFDLPAVIA